MNDSLKQEQLWDSITEDFREACLLRREGKPQAAERLLNDTLPARIASWSKLGGGKSEQKRAELSAMFAEEQRRVDTALVVQRVVSAKLTEQLVPSLCSTVAAEVKGVLNEQLTRLNSAMAETALSGSLRPRLQQSKRVRFDDIPGVIDAVLAEQRGGDTTGTIPIFQPPETTTSSQTQTPSPLSLAP